MALENGTPRWKEGRYGRGQMLLAGALLPVRSESGELLLLQPRPAALNEPHRFGVFSGKNWNPPAPAGDILPVRNDRKTACVRRPLAKVRQLLPGRPGWGLCDPAAGAAPCLVRKPLGSDAVGVSP